MNNRITMERLKFIPPEAGVNPASSLQVEPENRGDVTKL
jgi:hypothetical protein